MPARARIGFQLTTTDDNFNTNNIDYIYVAIRSSITPTITYDSSIKWELNLAPTSPALDEKDAYVFLTTDGGTTYYGKKA
ncbi:MAG: hypothetical protein ACO21P_11165, partial [Candidatus Nanopelagicales bacterium]